MANENYLKPKAKVPNFGKVQREQGMFVNVDSYPDLGGLTGANKLPGQNPSMKLERGPTAEKGKPV